MVKSVLKDCLQLILIFPTLPPSLYPHFGLLPDLIDVLLAHTRRFRNLNQLLCRGKHTIPRRQNIPLTHRESIYNRFLGALHPFPCLVEIVAW